MQDDFAITREKNCYIFYQDDFYLNCIFSNYVCKRLNFSTIKIMKKKHVYYSKGLATFVISFFFHDFVSYELSKSAHFP